MSTGTTTVRLTTETAQRIAALRVSDGRSTDSVVREALDALYWARMADAARRETPERREEREAEGALWDRAAAADGAPRR